MCTPPMPAEASWGNLLWCSRNADAGAAALERPVRELIRECETLPADLSGIARLLEEDLRTLASRVHYLRRRIETLAAEAGAAPAHRPPAPHHEL